MRTRKAVPEQLSLEHLLPKKKVHVDKGDSECVDVMVAEALLSDEQISEYDDGNGGMLEYVSETVLKLIKRMNKDAIKEVRAKINESPV